MTDLSSVFDNLPSTAFDLTGGSGDISNIGSTAADAFTSGGSNPFTDALSNVFSSPAFAADASSPQSLAAQTTLSPPSQGSPDAQAAAAGGTQSDPQNTQGPQGQPQQQNQQNQQNQQTAPQSAVDQLKKALQQLLKQQAQAKTVNQGSWEPTTAVGMQAPPGGGPAPIAPASGMAALLQQGGATDPSTYGGLPSTFTPAPTPGSEYGGLPGTFTPAPTLPGARGMPAPQGEPGEQPAGATPAEIAGASPFADPTQGAIPPAPPPTATPTGPAAPGGNITVRKAGAGTQAYEPGAAPEPQAGSTAAQPPQADGGPAPEAATPPLGPPHPMARGGDGTSQMIRDVLGIATGNPMALADLARQAMGGNPAAAMMLPLALGMMGGMGGGFGGRGRHGGFRGGRGGFRDGGFRHGGGFHHGGAGHWPYHAPGRGWQMHDRHPGPPWVPISPHHMHELMREMNQGQNAQNPMIQALMEMLGNERDQANQTGAHYPGDPSTGGRNLNGQTGEGYVDSGNPVVNTLTAQESPNGNVVSGSDMDSQGRTAAQGGNRNEISQGYFQIQNYPHNGTWATAAAKAGVDLNRYPTPMSAPFDIQYKVAREIPISAWTTKWALHQKYGSFPDSWTFGQVVDHFGPGGIRLAGQGGGGQTAGPAYEPGGSQMAAAQ